MEQPEIALHMATAKRGTWKNLTDLALYISKLIYNSYTCDFSTKDDGSYFLIAEGLTGVGYKLILVAPDNSIDFSTLENTNVVNALTIVRDYVGNTPIPGWDSFVTWFGQRMRQYGGYAGSATVCGQTVENMPLPTFPTNATQYDTFEWLRSVAAAANCDTVAMSGYKVGTYNKFAIPVTVSAMGMTVNIQIQMAI